MSNRKKREALPRDLEIRGAEIFGKHLRRKSSGRC